MNTFFPQRGSILMLACGAALASAACGASGGEAASSTGEEATATATPGQAPTPGGSTAPVSQDVLYIVTQALAGRARPALELHKGILRAQGFVVTESVVDDTVTDPEVIRATIRAHGGNNVAYVILAGRLPAPHYQGRYGTVTVPTLIYGNSEYPFATSNGNYVGGGGWSGDPSPRTAVGIIDFSRESAIGHEETLYTSYVTRLLAYSKRVMTRQNSVVTDQIDGSQTSFFAQAFTQGKRWDGATFTRSVVQGTLGAASQGYESFLFKAHGDPGGMVGIGGASDFARLPATGTPFGFFASCEVGRYEADNSLATAYLTGAGLAALAGTQANSGIPVQPTAQMFTAQNLSMGQALRQAVKNPQGAVNLDTGGWRPCPGSGSNGGYARDCWVTEYTAYTVLGDPTLQPVTAMSPPSTFIDSAMIGELAPRHSPLTPLSGGVFADGSPVELSASADGQPFAIRLAGSEDHIILEHNGACVNREASGALAMRGCNPGLPSQQFELRANGNLWHPASRTCVDVPWASRTPGQAVNTYGDCDGRGNQVVNVLASAPLVAWQNSEFNGDSVLLYPGRNDTAALNGGSMNDQISALELPPGASAQFFENGNFQGASATVTSSTAFYRTFWNDRISSVIVTRR